MLKDLHAGKFAFLKPEEVLEEMVLFLKNVDSEGTVFRANHASNYVILKGTLNRDIPAMLSQISKARENASYRDESWRSL